jgi:hypothetical protein
VIGVLTMRARCPKLSGIVGKVPVADLAKSMPESAFRLKWRAKKLGAPRSERAAEWAGFGGERAHKERFVGVDFCDDTLYGSYAPIGQRGVVMAVYIARCAGGALSVLRTVRRHSGALSCACFPEPGWAMTTISTDTLSSALHG